MKIITYNVNGLRAALSKGFTQWLEEEQPDGARPRGVRDGYSGL